MINKLILKEDTDDIEVLDDEIELIDSDVPDYSKGSKEYMNKFINAAKSRGATLTIKELVSPLRTYTFWYRDVEILAEIKTSEGLVITIYPFVDGSITVGDQYVDTTEEIEAAGLYTDEDIDAAYSHGDLDYDDLVDYYSYSIHKEIDGVQDDSIPLVYHYDLTDEDIHEIDEALNVNYYLDYSIPLYKEYIQRFSTERNGGLNEDKAGKERFITKVGKELADRFYAVKPRLKAPESDISYWMSKNPEELENVVAGLETTLTRKQKDSTARDGSVLLYSDEDWSVYEILNLEASRKYGKNSKWCISGDDCESEERWNSYRKDYEDFPAGDSKFIFFISKMFADKYAVLYNEKTKKRLIWNDVDNPVAFILDGPKVDGLPDFSIIPESLKDEIAKSLGITKKQIVSIVNSYQDAIPGGDNIEKYSVEYRNKNGTIIIVDLYRDLETEHFVPIEE